MSKVTVQQVIDALSGSYLLADGVNANDLIAKLQTQLAIRIQEHGIAPPDGMVLVKKQTPELFAQWFRSQIPDGTIIGNTDWWANRISEQFMQSETEATPTDNKQVTIEEMTKALFCNHGVISDLIYLDNIKRRIRNYGIVGTSWISIDTPPKDGTDVLIYYKGDIFIARGWNNVWYVDGDGDRGTTPEFWMPLPTPPTKTGDV